MFLLLPIKLFPTLSSKFRHREELGKNENVLKSVTIDGAVCKRGNRSVYV
jgi:hypothetical protein